MVQKDELFAKLRERQIQNMVSVLRKGYATQASPQLDQLIYDLSANIIDRTLDKITELSARELLGGKAEQWK